MKSPVRTRKIDGRLFSFKKPWHFNKSKAVKTANKYRGKGYNARVVYVDRTKKEKEKWGVFVGGKKK